MCFFVFAERMKKKDKYKRMKQDTRTDRDSLTSRMKKGKVSPYPGETGASADLFDTKKHRQHFAALQMSYPQLRTGRLPSARVRVCGADITWRTLSGGDPSSKNTGVSKRCQQTARASNKIPVEERGGQAAATWLSTRRQFRPSQEPL